MTVYVDTSVLVAALTHENSTERAQIWLTRLAPQILLSSEWVRTEFSAALSVKLRIGDIDRVARSDALAKFDQLSTAALDIRKIRSEHFRKAASLANSHESGLRAGDALHLAIATIEGAAIATLDHRLAKAAEALGVAHILI